MNVWAVFIFQLYICLWFVTVSTRPRNQARVAACPWPAKGQRYPSQSRSVRAAFFPHAPPGRPFRPPQHHHWRLPQQLPQQHRPAVVAAPTDRSLDRRTPERHPGWQDTGGGRSKGVYSAIWVVTHHGWSGSELEVECAFIFLIFTPLEFKFTIFSWPHPSDTSLWGVILPPEERF